MKIVSVTVGLFVLVSGTACWKTDTKPSNTETKRWMQTYSPPEKTNTPNQPVTVEAPKNDLSKKLPFAIVDLLSVTGQPTRFENGNWFFTANGGLFPYLILFTPSEEQFGVMLEYSQENKNAVAALFESKLFTAAESEGILQFVAEAKKKMLNDESAIGETIVGRYSLNYYTRGGLGRWKALSVRAAPRN